MVSNLSDDCFGRFLDLEDRVATTMKVKKFMAERDARKQAEGEVREAAAAGADSTPPNTGETSTAAVARGTPEDGVDN